MNKFIMSVSAAVLLMVASCTIIDDGYNKYREDAWEYIGGSTDKTIIGTMYDGKFKDNTTYDITDGASFTISWNTTQDALLGPITVHFSKTENKILGMELRL